MGYTHYWRPLKGIEPTTFARLSKEAARVASIVKSEALAGAGLGKDPEFTSEVIRFNGKDGEGHETFLLTADPSEFNFCKTAQKPYDIVVVAILCLLAHHTEIEVSSDGRADDWAAGLKLAQRVVPECQLPGSVVGR